MKHRRVISVIAMVMLLAALTAMPVGAQFPVPPCQFSGSVMLDGNPVDDGTEIVAKVDDTVVGGLVAPVANSEYSYLIPQDPDTGFPPTGATVNFFVAGYPATTTGDEPTWAAGGMKTVNLAAESVVVPEPDISVSPASIAFGDVTVGSSSTSAVTISNVGDAALTITGITITGTDAGQFSVGTYPGTIAAGGSADVNVTFSPTTEGAKSATLNIASDDPDEATVTVALSGTGVTEVVEEFETFADWLYNMFIA